MKKIKVGVVGVGYFGQFHAEKYARMEGAELIGVADIDSSRAAKVAEQCRTRAFPSHADLFDKVEAVSLSVPTILHAAMAREFLLRGIDVLIEKPIAHGLEEADEMVRLAKSKRLILQVGHLERFNGALEASRGLMPDPRYIQSERSSPFPDRGIDVNVILDLMIHDIDILLTFVRSPIRQIEAFGIPVLTSHSDMANARIEFKNGCVADLTVSRVSEEKVRTARLYSPQGTLFLDYLRQKVFRTDKTSSSRILSEEIPVQRIDTLQTEIETFLQSVNDRSPARVSAEDGKRALEVAFQVIGKMDERREGRRKRK